MIMEHTTRKGAPRLLEACTLPLTAVRCVRRVFTDLAVTGYFRASAGWAQLIRRRASVLVRTASGDVVSRNWIQRQ